MRLDSISVVSFAYQVQSAMLGVLCLSSPKCHVRIPIAGTGGGFKFSFPLDSWMAGQPAFLVSQDKVPFDNAPLVRPASGWRDPDPDRVNEIKESIY